jgi:outer membrane protein OmpA-like peptidoglycan-associated protein
VSTQHYIAHVEDEESYFISMTDVVIGLLFIFIIMLMFFAMRFQQATHVQNEETQKQIEVTQKQNELIGDLTDAESARSEILDQLGSVLSREGIRFIVVKDEGILRLPEEILFDKSSWELKAHTKGPAPLRTLGRALDQVLPCYTTGPRSRQTGCPKTKAKVDAIFIEGHADSDQFRTVAPPVTSAPPSPQRPPPSSQQPGSNKPGSLSNWLSPNEPANNLPIPIEPNRTSLVPMRANVPPKDNLDLSTLRATSTFRELLKVQPALTQFLSPNNTPILSVAGYGDYRPLAREEGETIEKYKQRNRRIDLRILMAGVKSEDARRMQQDIQGFEAHP